MNTGVSANIYFWDDCQKNSIYQKLRLIKVQQTNNIKFIVWATLKVENSLYVYVRANVGDGEKYKQALYEHFNRLLINILN